MNDTKHICVAVLAHVDAGKTTLSEAMLYLSGTIRRAGRVDNKDAYLDTYEIERERGITIYSKQAEFTYRGTEISLLDTPGHVDFSAEMERTLHVLDYAILVVSGADGVQSHTRTLWKLLRRYEVPVFIFVNKMDQDGTDRERLMEEIRSELDGACVDFTGQSASEEFLENIAVCDEAVLESFLATGEVTDEQIRELIKERKLFPCCFGSALKLEGVEEFLEVFDRYTEKPHYGEDFGARVFKISRDEQGKRLTYIKVTGGSLRIKDTLTGRAVEKAGQNTASEDGKWSQKVNQIRIYSGGKYECTEEVTAGRVCAIAGLTDTYPGEGLGFEEDGGIPVLEPVLTYMVVLPEGVDASQFLPKLRQVEEEEPLLHVIYQEETGGIQVQLMGEVQTEILKSLVAERFGVDIAFDTGHIVYKETIANTVEGVGHFEPLRHYAEVHLVMEPGEPGSGLAFEADCSTDMLSLNWQRLIMTHLAEREHKGVLTGSAITDMKITLKSGKAHLKHTEGGDFRQATYRAVRQGLMQAENILLEPFYSFTIELPRDAVGHAMTDIDRMCGTCVYDGENTITGRAPVSEMQNYQKELSAYTRGLGRIMCTFDGYYPCHNADEVIGAVGYFPDEDLRNPSSSVFCAHGAGFAVPWNEVKRYMHLESCLDTSAVDEYGGAWDEELMGYAGRGNVRQSSDMHDGRKSEEIWLGTDEIDEILNRTYNANRKGAGEASRNTWKLRRGNISAESGAGTVKVRDYSQIDNSKPAYLLVDGYNVIFAWKELSELAESNIDGARGRLLDIMSNYRGMAGCEVIVVFDAYRVQGHKTEIFDYHNIHVVFTREAETADQYIEKFAHENAKKYRVTVATSDGLEQIIIRGAGCLLISARELEAEVMRQNRQIAEEYLIQSPGAKSYMSDVMEDVLKKLNDEENES